MLSNVKCTTSKLILDATMRGDVAFFKTALRKRGPSIFNISDTDGCTPLLLACKHGQEELVKFFIANGVSMTDRDRDSKRQGQAIHYAAWGGHLPIFLWLVESGAQLNSTDIVGNTPLLYAVYGGHRHIVEECLRLGRTLTEKKQQKSHRHFTSRLRRAPGAGGMATGIRV